MHLNFLCSVAEQAQEDVRVCLQLYKQGFKDLEWERKTYMRDNTTAQLVWAEDVLGFLSLNRKWIWEVLQQMLKGQ